MGSAERMEFIELQTITTQGNIDVYDSHKEKGIDIRLDLEPSKTGKQAQTMQDSKTAHDSKSPISSNECPKRPPNKPSKQALPFPIIQTLL